MAIQQDSDDEYETGDFINQADVVEEIEIDEEDLLDADEEDDAEGVETRDDAVHIFSGHGKEPVYAVACSPIDSKLVATGGGDDTVFLWRIGEGNDPIKLSGAIMHSSDTSFSAHTESISSLVFSRDGTLLASGGLDGLVCIWNTQGNLLRTFEGPGADIEWLYWHPRGNVILAGSQDFTTWMWNADTGHFLALFTGHNGAVTCGCFTPDGRLVCTGSSDCSLRVWNPRTGECIRAIQGHPYHVEGVTCLAINRDATLAISGSLDGKACLVNIQNGRVTGVLSEHSAPINCVAFSPSLPLAATGGRDKKLIVWDLQTLTVRFTGEHEDDIYRIIWTVSELIITACYGGLVRVWDARTGTCQRTFHGHEEDIQDIALTCDGHGIVTGSDDNTARVFEL